VRSGRGGEGRIEVEHRERKEERGRKE